jgi:two-component system, NtrC family, sensor histidine kinase HydH
MIQKWALASRKEWGKILIVAFITGGTLCLQIFTPVQMRYEHAVYRMFFYIPLFLGGFWFGLKGALSVSGTVTVFYLLYLMDQFRALSFEVFDSYLELGLFLILALIFGLVVETGKKQQKALLQAGSLAAVGRAVSELAHDLKTPLVAIGGLAIQVSRGLHSESPDRKKLDIVIQETARLESMVQEMLDFSKPVELHQTRTSLNSVIMEVMEMMQAVAKKAGVELNVDLDPSLPDLMLDAARVRHVPLNLITNALQASSPGESILAKTRRVRKGVILEVTDRGPGIQESDRGKVFSPFFSTKRGGTGLGLAIVKRITEAHGGEVSFHPNPGKGVTFLVRFPD